MKYIKGFVITLIFSFLIISCQVEEKEPQIKYAFLFIGDGMGVAQVNLTEAYLAALKNEKGFEQLSFTQFPHAGLVKTFANNRFITCSAAAGTAFATGNKTNINHIATDTSGLVPFKSIATICKESGMKVGVLSSVSIDHATPAVFYAHQPLRSNYFEIGIDLANSDFDFFGGGGFRNPIDTLDGTEVNTVNLALENGFKYIDTEAGLKAITAADGKVIAVHPNINSSAAMPYVIDKPSGPSLADYTSKAIEVLENEAGFFIMVEGGKIDWACHSKDAASSIHETVAFDEAIQKAINFYKKHPDETLIIVTADHETGGLALGNEITEYESYFHLLQYQKTSIDEFNIKLTEFGESISGNFEKDLDGLLNLLAVNFGLGNEISITEEEKSKLWFAFEKSLQDAEAKETTYSEMPLITKVVIDMMSEKAGVGWTTYSHTGINIPIYAIGPGAEKFTGVIDNTEIPELILGMLPIQDLEKTKK